MEAKAEGVPSLDDEGGSSAAPGSSGSLSASSSSGAKIKLISKDGKEFLVEKDYAMISNLVKTSLDSDTSASDLPMPGVRGEVLGQVVEFMKHHRGVEPAPPEKPLRSKEMRDVCKDPWDADFIDNFSDNRQVLFDLILAANYMDIKSLLQLGCAKVAAIIKGTPLEKVKDILSKPVPTGSEKVLTKNPSGK